MNDPTRILVVDDDADLRIGTARLLEKAGYIVDQAADGEAALQSIRQRRPDLLLLDRHMPGLDGLEACRQIKQDPAFADMVIILVSGIYAESSQQAEGLEFGADDYIARPIANRELLARVQAHVRILSLTRTLQSKVKELEMANAAASQGALASLNLLEDVVAARDQMNATNQILRQEVKERKQAEEALHLSEEKCRTLIEQSTDGIVISDEHGNVSLWNKGTESITGLHACDTLGVPLWKVQAQLMPDEIKTPELLEQLRTGMEKIIQSENDWQGKSREQAILCADGKRKTVQDSTFLIKTDNAVMIGTILRDITERKQVEEKLIASEKNFRQIAETIKEVFWISEPDWSRIHYISPAYNDVWGEEAEKLYEQPFLWLDSIIEEDKEKVRSCISKTITKDIKEIHFPDYRIKKSDGAIIWISARAFPIFDSEGNPQRIAGIAEDITERKQAEEENARLEAQLHQAQKMETVGQLAGGVAHDFNNMLQVILSYVEMSLAKVVAGHPLQKYLLQIQRAARRSAEITAQLLAFARKQTVSPKVLDVNDAVLGTQKMIQRLIGEDIDLVWMPGHDLWRVMIDPSQLDQVLANLAVNARDAIGGVGKLTMGTENVTVDEAYCATHAGCVPGDYVLLAVSDDGCGMDKETLSHMFEPFFSTKEQGKGTGLGLATVYGIVKQNNGFITVSSEPGEGSTFKVYLPRAEGAPGADAQDVEGVTPRGGTETVLVVEDEAAILQMARMSLEHLGYTVLSAGLPEEALSAAEGFAGPIQILITDVVMPQMNGRQLAQRLRGVRPEMKCLYISGYTADVIAHRGVLEEGVNFIAKPFSLTTLAEKVREVLDGPAGGSASTRPSP